jgi:glycosyltransferase EpsE
MKNFDINISVIMPVYNEEENISQSIESILNQTYKNFELLLLDDRSTDKTYEIIKMISTRESRIRVFKNERNIGLTKCLNYLIGESKGKYIARQDADDISIKNRLEKQYKLLENSKYNACSTRAYVKNSNTKIPGLSTYLPINLVMKYKNPIIHGTLMIEKTALKNINNYDEDFYYAQDYKLISDLLKNYYKFKRINSALYILNMENNISSNFSKEQKYFADCVRNGTSPIAK